MPISVCVKRVRTQCGGPEIAVIESAGERTVDTVDGVRVVEDDGSWALVLPDPAEAMTRLWAEARSEELANALLDDWTEVVDKAGR